MTLLEVFVLTWNEEKIIQDFITWYRQRVPDCLITVYDNMSDDGTVTICQANGCKVVPFDTGGKMDELTQINLRNTIWKQSEAQYVIVCDADEWVDVDRDMLLRNNEENEWDVCKCMGYEMFGTEEDTIDTLVRGTWSAGYCKPVLWKKDKVKEINFGAGSHNANPSSPVEGTEVAIKKNFPKLFHTKHRSWSGMLEKAAQLAQRRSEDSKRKGWNFHYSLPEAVHKDYRDNGIKNSIRVR